MLVNGGLIFYFLIYRIMEMIFIFILLILLTSIFVNTYQDKEEIKEKEIYKEKAKKLIDELLIFLENANKK